ncbi:MAG: early E1A protein [Christensenellales bacterium]
MRSSGNGRPEVCVNNLLMTVRGEVPYERIKGLDSRIIDAPSSTIKNSLQADIRWLVGTYEPRASFDGIDLKALEAKIGGFELGANFDINPAGRREKA